MGYYSTSNRRKRSLSDFPTMFFTVVVALLCRAAGYCFSIGLPLQKGDSYLWNAVAGCLGNPVVACSAGLFAALVIAVMIYNVCEGQMLIEKRSRLPFALPLLLTSINAGLLPVSEVYVILLCMVITVSKLFYSYCSADLTGPIYIGFVFIGVASLFAPQMLWLVPMALIGMYQLNSLGFKSFIAAILGVAVVFWIAFGWCVLWDDYSIFSSFVDELFGFRIITLNDLLEYQRAGAAMFMIILAISFVRVKMDTFHNSVKVRQMLSFLINLSVWTLLMILLFQDKTDLFLAVLSIPASILIAYFLENIRSRFSFILYYLLLFLYLSSFVVGLWSFL